MSFTVIIPARLSSTRLPRKPLADIAGRPMVARVAERAGRSGAGRVVVAADHPDIAAACAACGVTCLLTSPAHPSGTDRLAEAAAALGLADDELVVNVQGDEPLIPPAVIDEVALTLRRSPECAMATAAHPIRDYADFTNPNVVKVALSRDDRALYFSRAPIPWPRELMRAGSRELDPAALPWHHVGVYAYRVGFLREFPQLPRAPLEETEMLEQLRALWHGYQIRVSRLSRPLPAGVDSAADLARVRALWSGEPTP